MIEPIQIKFPLQMTNVISNSKIGVQEWVLLPQPQKIEIQSDLVAFPLNIVGYVDKINPNHDVLRLFQEDWVREFNINIKWTSKDADNSSSQDRNYPSDIPVENTESYAISIDSNEISILSNSTHGLFNAFQTLFQLIRNAQQLDSIQKIDNVNHYLIPQCQIKDWPMFPMRGISDDVARGQSPSLQQLKDFIKELTHYKLNYYFLYLEDMFQCSHHPAIGENRGAYSAEELRELDQFAQKRFVTIVPIFETLGHLDNILLHPEYTDLGEFPGAHCLALGNGNIYPFLRNFLTELISCFTSPFFHIGLDETYDLDHGKSQELIKAVGKVKALEDHIRRINTILTEHSERRLIIYHDLIIKYPSLLSRLPKNTIIMYWDYASTKTKFPQVDMLAQTPLHIILSPSLLNWSRHFPDYGKAIQNLNNFLKYSKNFSKKGPTSQTTIPSPIKGIINSIWGDYSHYNVRSNHIYGMILTASGAWTGNPIQLDRLINCIGKFFYGFRTPDLLEKFMHIFNDLCNFHSILSKDKNFNPQHFFDAIFRPPYHTESKTPDFLAYLAAREVVEKHINSFDQLSAQVKYHRKYLLGLRVSLNFLKLGAEKESIHQKVLNSIDNKSQLGDLKAAIRQFLPFLASFRAEYSENWLDFAQYPMLNRVLSRFDYLQHTSETILTQLQVNDAKGIQFLPSYWIWSNKGNSSAKTRYFRKKCILPGVVLGAKVQLIAGNVANLFVNGEFIGSVKSRNSLSILPNIEMIQVFDITSFLHSGENIIAVEANHYLQSTGAINFYAQIQTSQANKETESHSILSDQSWVCSEEKFETWDWTEVSYDPNLDKAHKWKKIKLIGISPSFNGYLFQPNLFKDEQSLSEDMLWHSANQFYSNLFVHGKMKARFSHFLNK